MSAHVEDLLHDWFLGTLSDEETVQVDEHLASCPACQAAFDQHLALLAEASETTAAPSVDSVLVEATTLRRFRRFAEKIADLSDVALETANGWLSKIDEAATWTETALGALQLFHIEGGPSVEDAIFGFVKLDGGTPFPEHTHLGREKIFVIQGQLRDENGDLHGPGSLVVREEGTTHEISAEPGVPLIYLNIVHGGLEIFGMQFGPDSPEF